jgi:DUF2892 family protein
LIQRNVGHLISADQGLLGHRRTGMSANMGAIDRMVRFAVSLVPVAFAIPIGFAPSGRIWLSWFGIVPLVTAILGVNPLYTLIGVSTCRMRRAG